MTTRTHRGAVVLLACGIVCGAHATGCSLGRESGSDATWDEAALTAAPGDVSAGRVDAKPIAPPDLFDHIPTGQDQIRRATAHLEAEPQPDAAPWNPARMVEWVDVAERGNGLEGPLRIEYSMDVELTRKIFRLMRIGRVPRGHVIVMEPESGRMLAYASTAPEDFPATRAYPAASLIKVVTAAAALDADPANARRHCRYRGSPYRLTPSRVYPPLHGIETTLERSLATSNNQCFAQLAVNAVGGQAMLDAISRFGWLQSPAPGHEAGSANVGEDDYELGRLGCGLAGCNITPLHAVQLASSLVRGDLVEPWWIERVVDVKGRSLELPPRREPRKIMTPDLARELREMLVHTTTGGTARSAFRDRRGRPRLGAVRVAGKTGNLTGDSPPGRYEWFIGVAPAEAPTVAIAVLQLQSDLWWMRSSEIAAEVLSTIFCVDRECRAELASRYADEVPGDFESEHIEAGG